MLIVTHGPLCKRRCQEHVPLDNTRYFFIVNEFLNYVFKIKLVTNDEVILFENTPINGGTIQKESKEKRIDVSQGETEDKTCFIVYGNFKTLIN